MQSLLPLAEKIAARLIERHETIAVTESSTGGLIAAALLSVPGASAYFLGGAVAYTKAARLGAARHRRCRAGGLAAFDRSLFVADRAAGARAARRELGPGRNRRHRADRQPLRRRGRSHVYRGCRINRARNYAGDRQRRPAGQYGYFRQAGAGAFLRRDFRQGLKRTTPPLPPSPSALVLYGFARAARRSA